MLDLETRYQKNSQMGTVDIVPPNPYLSFMNRDEKMYVQCGKFYNGLNSPEIEPCDVPKWVWDILRVNYSEDVRKKYSVVLPEEVKLTVPEKKIEAEKKRFSLWKCPECDKELSFQAKGVHMAAHGRERIKAEKAAKKLEAEKQTVEKGS